MSATNRGGKRDPKDFYPTPPWCTRALLDRWDLGGGVLLDPACGEGDIIAVASSYGISCRGIEIDEERAGLVNDTMSLGSDDIAIHGDALLVEWPDFDNIVGNFPFSLCAEIARKGLSLLKPDKRMALYEKITWLTSSRTRLDVVNSPHLRWIGYFVDRPSHTDDGNTDAIGYAWYLWEKGWTGETKIEPILDRKPKRRLR